jgi:hypothetical protein
MDIISAATLLFLVIAISVQMLLEGIAAYMAELS